MSEAPGRLVFDVGANHGEDTDFYLAKGMRVVAIEANPLLAEELRACYGPAIETGQLIVENIGLMDRRGTLRFYRNLDCDHWSSFFSNYGARDGTRFEVIEVATLTLRDLFARHGVPYYLKVDIEGADELVLRQLQAEPAKPAFVSVEEYGIQTLGDLAAAGYDAFSIRTQYDKSWCVQDGSEGPIVERDFTHRDAGLFGREVPDWLSLPEALAAFARDVRDEAGALRKTNGEFYDIHATRRPTPGA